MWRDLLPGRRAQIGAVCGLFYGDRKTTRQISRLVDMPEAEVWNILSRHGARWRKRYMGPPGRMARWLWRNG